MKKTNKLNLIPIVLLCYFFLFSSCYTTRVKQLNSVEDTTRDGEEYRERTIHMTLWSSDITWIEDTCPSGALSEVSVESNLGQSILNVITIGLYKPITVRYKCSKN